MLSHQQARANTMFAKFSLQPISAASERSGDINFNVFKTVSKSEADTQFEYSQ
jgi:hypothetical protein